MRREGRLHGWVRTYELFADPLELGPSDADGGKRRPAAAHRLVAGPTANGGYVRVSGKPTNHSKPTGRDPSRSYRKRKASKGRRKFQHKEIKMYYYECLDDAVSDVGM